MTTTIETETQTTDERIATRLSELMERQDELDLSRTMAQRELNANLAHTALLEGRINAIRNAAATVARLPTLDAETGWLEHLNTWRTTLCAELLSIKSPIRDRDTKERADGLTFSIRLIDHGLGFATLPVVTLTPTPLGKLMAEAGYETESSGLHGPRGWRGSLQQVEQRIKALAQQRTAAQAALDAALMTDEERTEQEAEEQALRNALNNMRVTGSADGRSLVAYTKDGDVLDVSEMTPTQRKAFERMDAAHRRVG